METLAGPLPYAGINGPLPRMFLDRPAGWLYCYPDDEAVEC